jgi:hypothetical protein
VPVEGSVTLEKLADMVDVKTLTFVREADGIAHFVFTREFNLGGSKPVKLSGALEYDEKLDTVTFIGLEAPAPFHPQSGVKVREFRMSFTFERFEDRTVRVIPVSVKSHVAGTAMLVMSFDEDSELRFSGYRQLPVE